jgi:hypothetical protein
VSIGGPVRIPDYLRRPEMVTRTGASVVDVERRPLAEPLIALPRAAKELARAENAAHRQLSVVPASRRTRCRSSAQFERDEPSDRACWWRWEARALRSEDDHRLWCESRLEEVRIRGRRRRCAAPGGGLRGELAKGVNEVAAQRRPRTMTESALVTARAAASRAVGAATGEICHGSNRAP